ncbi:Aste57867_15031 [Aphanomyces stellatus]|uniref:Importin subunit alpha n=1 Tax=Aphanomyces stellatus TaxID=120398 RepID=A0A485L2G8_9STRA|nr:hypothetical protein As57867_014975 [Aphanomyces stellatus]VFT91845.1 Aste57867_15031 [Aphanomyces stellatus]
MQSHESVKAKTQLKKSTRARAAHGEFVRKSKQSALNKRRRLPDEGVEDMDDLEFQKLLQALAASPEHTLPILEQMKTGLSACSAERLDRVAESGVIPILLELLERPSSTTMELTQILWCLTFITSGLYEHTRAVLPAVPTLLSFVETPELAEHAAWTLGNIAADCEEFRLHLIRHGAIPPLVEHLHHPQNADMLKVSLWALSNMARGTQTSAKAFFDQDIGAVALALLQANETPDVVQELLWLLSFLTAKEDKYLHWLLEHDLLGGLLHHVDDKDSHVLTPLLRVCGNICSVGPDAAEWQLPYIHALASEPRFLFMLKRLLQLDHDPQVVAEAAWVTSNLAARDVSVVNTLVQHDFVQRLGLCFRDGGYETRKEASFALYNIAVTAAYAPLVVEQDVLDGFVALLTVADPNVVANALSFVEHVLRHVPQGVFLVESAGGIDALESVQDGASDYLATKAEQLVNEFYGETYDAPLSPTSTSAPSSSTSGILLIIKHSHPHYHLAISFQGPPSSSSGGGGMGRGAHMTRPAWATQQH